MNPNHGSVLNADPKIMLMKKIVINVDYQGRNIMPLLEICDRCYHTEEKESTDKKRTQASHKIIITAYSHGSKFDDQFYVCKDHLNDVINILVNDPDMKFICLPLDPNRHGTTYETRTKVRNYMGMK